MSIKTHELTNQAIFDLVVYHLRTQGQISQEIDYEMTMCLYRGPNGLKCAAGILIPDEEYQKNFEGVTIDAVPFFKNFTPHQCQLIYKLQTIHDQNFPENWEDQFQACAKLFGLNYVPTP